MEQGASEKKQYIWDFLTDLQDNNSKEWMDEHRRRYQTARKYWLEQVEAVLQRLSQHDSYFEQFTAKDTVMRINNNRVFHPDKPVYKGHFACSPSGKTDQISSVFFAFGPEFTFIGGGIYRPESSALKAIREAIDYDANELLQIVEAPDFKRLFGGLATDETQLKRIPKGYPKEHPHAELLKRKSFTASYVPTPEDLIHHDLPDIIEAAYLQLRPLKDWIEKALSVPS